MRILHTADWHLGRLFYGRHLTEDQDYVLNHQFLPLLKEANIDAVVLAGDVYDRAVPPVEAVSLWDQIVAKTVLEAHIPLFLISGNHDSSQRLTAGQALLAKQGLYMRGPLYQQREPILLEDAYGLIAFYLFPYVEPQQLEPYLGEETTSKGSSVESSRLGEETFGTLFDYVEPEEQVAFEESDKPIESKRQLHAYGDLYRQWTNRALASSLGQIEERPKLAGRSVALAHAFVTGGKESSSERLLSLGGTETISRQAFEGFSYTALGHLHRPQTCGSETIRYSGSLLPYSFDEAKDRKSFTIVDIDAKGKSQIELVPILPKHRVVVIEDYFDAILENQDFIEDHKNDYVLARTLDTAPVFEGMQRLRQVLPYVMAIEPVGRMQVDHKLSVKDNPLKPSNEESLFIRFIEEARGQALTKEEIAYMQTLWTRARKEDI